VSDLSYPHCQQPDYACECADPEHGEPALGYLLGKEKIPKNHPFRKAREAMVIRITQAEFREHDNAQSKHASEITSVRYYLKSTHRLGRNR
jgi:hypothetical protein